MGFKARCDALQSIAAWNLSRRGSIPTPGTRNRSTAGFEARCDALRSIAA
jgi:hypothetical protein